MGAVWKTVRDRYTSHDVLCFGVIPVAQAEWNSLQSRGGPAEEKYRWRLKLPGKERAGKCATLEEAKVAAEAALEEWLTAARLSRTEAASDVLDVLSDLLALCEDAFVKPNECSEVLAARAIIAKAEAA